LLPAAPQPAATRGSHWWIVMVVVGLIPVMLYLVWLLTGVR